MSRDKAVKVEQDRVVVLRFTLKDDAGNLLDEGTDEEPLVYLHGHEELLDPVEEALAGKEVGDRTSVTLTPEEGFGRKIDDAERTLPRDLLPEDAPVEPGTAFAIEDDGDLTPVWVVRATDAHVVVSLCHPYAGKTVTFDLEVLKIRDATEEELEHGHAHGLEGGAHPD